MQPVTRRRFLRTSAIAGAATFLTSEAWASAGAPLMHRAAPAVDLAVARGDSPERNCLAAVEALGGFARFVRPGDFVVIKPNPIGTSPPEAALHTHPAMLAAVIRACREVGARRIVALSHDSRRSMIVNGTAAAVTEAGGELHALEREEEFREVVVPRGRVLRRERIAAELLEADVFINMPIAKHHAGSEVTLAMKNLMGVNWDRITFHRTDLQRCIAELASVVPHTLVIMDANHVLLTNGPGGPGEVRAGRQVIAGVDPVAVDAFATRAFFTDPARIGHIRIAHELGVGEVDLAKLRIREFEA
ncbi:MAG: DUF362 domain-containing protein [Candidatus Eisenbacteria bacterium]|nr:DUF362 domain-containing protein [Candidatus Eisenbacteria bacterium]